jgi:hypothetical protein
LYIHEGSAQLSTPWVPFSPYFNCLIFKSKFAACRSGTPLHAATKDAGFNRAMFRHNAQRRSTDMHGQLPQNCTAGSPLGARVVPTPDSKKGNAKKFAEQKIFKRENNTKIKAKQMELAKKNRAK